MRQRFALVFGLLSLALPGQCIQLGGSGCPVSISPNCTSQPRIGRTLTVPCPACKIGEAGISVLGLCLTWPNWPTFYQPFSCQIGPCRLATSIVATFVPAAITVPIPNNTALIGQSVCLQCACVNQAKNCFDLQGALQVVIQSF
jgi:hypothetical protein